MVSVPTRTPAAFRRGVTVKWGLSLPDYPSPTWALTYNFAASTDHRSATAANDGAGGFLITISGTDSAAFSASLYAYVATVTAAGETYEVESGQITILPALTAAVETRSEVKQQLDTVREKIRLLLSKGDVSSYSFGTSEGSRSVVRRPLAELREEEKILLRRYAAERERARIRKGLPIQGRIRTRYV